MSTILKRESCQKILDVSRETIDSCDIYLSELIKWQKNLNLVGLSTLYDPWRRHVLDCGQVARYIKNKNEEIIDVGSGAGLPGVILSILGFSNVSMVESDYKKTIFISEVIRKCNISANVLNKRIETFDKFTNKTLVFRAFASIEKTLKLLCDKIESSTKLIFLKGKNAINEKNNGLKVWEELKTKYDYKIDPIIKTYTSISDKDSFLVTVEFKKDI
jgi:16S rRNA (guanine527-N7)-methyltransferase